jgi:transposase-like protein
METLPMADTIIKCPSCGSDALYRYGHTSNEKQRYLCLMCGRQFTLGANRLDIKLKPVCPRCGKLMHLYKRENGLFRFRCSDYPECRTYKKVTTEKEEK